MTGKHFIETEAGQRQKALSAAGILPSEPVELCDFGRALMHGETGQIIAHRARAGWIAIMTARRPV
jgi:hypothetical protein